MVKIKFGASISRPPVERCQPYRRWGSKCNEARIPIHFHLRGWYHWLSRLYFASRSTDGIRRSTRCHLKFVVVMAQMYSKGNVHHSWNRFTNQECGINKAGQPRLDSLNEQEFFPYCSIRFWQWHLPAKLINFVDSFLMPKVSTLIKLIRHYVLGMESSHISGFLMKLIKSFTNTAS